MFDVTKFMEPIFSKKIKTPNNKKYEEEIGKVNECIGKIRCEQIQAYHEAANVYLRKGEGDV